MGSNDNFGEWHDRELEDAYRDLVERDLAAAEDEAELRWDRLNRDVPLRSRSLWAPTEATWTADNTRESLFAVHTYDLPARARRRAGGGDDRG